MPTGPMDRRFRVLSGPGLVLYVLTITFMSVDWVMSLDPHWYSTIFGILMLGGQGLSTLAFTILVLALARAVPADVRRSPTPEKFHDLGKLMFAFVMLWAYFSVSQLLIIWSANLPEEIPFYLERLHGAWARSASRCCIGQFVLPFLLLLSRELKRQPRTRARGSRSFILVMRVVDIAWTIGPVFRHEGSGLSAGSTSRWCSAWAALWLFLFFAQPGRPRAGAGARPVLQGSDGSWRTLTHARRARSLARSRATASATRGIVWFVVILDGHDAVLPGARLGHVRAAGRVARPSRDVARAPLAAPATRRTSSTAGPRPAPRRSRDAASTSRHESPGRSASTKRQVLDALRLGRQERRHRPASRSIARRTWCSSAGSRARATAPREGPAGKGKYMQPRLAADGVLGPWPWAFGLTLMASAAAAQPQGPLSVPPPGMAAPSRSRCCVTSASIRSSTRRCRSTRRSSTRPARTSTLGQYFGARPVCSRSCTTSARCSARRC